MDSIRIWPNNCLHYSWANLLCFGVMNGWLAFVGFISSLILKGSWTKNFGFYHNDFEHFTKYSIYEFANYFSMIWAFSCWICFETLRIKNKDRVIMYGLKWDLNCKPVGRIFNLAIWKYKSKLITKPLLTRFELRIWVKIKHYRKIWILIVCLVLRFMLKTYHLLPWSILYGWPSKMEVTPLDLGLTCKLLYQIRLLLWFFLNICEGRGSQVLMMWDN